MTLPWTRHLLCQIVFVLLLFVSADSVTRRSSGNIVVPSGQIHEKKAWVTHDTVEVDQDHDYRELETTNTEEFDGQVVLSSALIFNYRIETLVEPNDALHVELVYSGGSAYLALATASTPEGLMTPAEAVIGIPGLARSSTNPGKYSMTQYSVRGVTPMTEEQQTLRDATIESNATHTVLRYTKFLVEDGELPIQASEASAENTTFLWAIGSPEFLGHHDARNDFVVSLATGMSTTSLDGSTASLVGSTGPTTNYGRVFAAHGIMAGLAWLFFTPVAIAASWVRDLPVPRWIYVHKGGNIISALLTVTTFILAVVVQYQKNPNHRTRSDKHFVTGWVIAFLVVAQMVGGLLRPPAQMNPSENGMEGSRNKENGTNGNGTGERRGSVSSGERERRGSIGGASLASFATGTFAVTGEYPKSIGRRIWEIAHRVVGWTMLAVALWQVYTGLILYHETYNGGGKAYIDLYAGWIVAMGVVILGLKGYTLYQLRSKLYDNYE